jgi:uncharacterized protein (TIGR02246 family)
MKYVKLAAFAMLAVAALDASLAQDAARAADERAIKAVIQEFLDARAANDPARLRAILTADVDQQQTSGATRRGRDAVVSGSLDTQRSTGGKRTISVESLRFVAADVAIADGRYDSLGRADGSDRHMLTSMVLKREAGSWKIAAIRNALPTGQ